METDMTKLERAISRAVNYHGLDARLGMPDFKIAELIAPEVQRHLDGQTDVQVFEAMTPDERAKIGSQESDLSRAVKAARKAATGSEEAPVPFQGFA